jgi:hypothetical protein
VVGGTYDYLISSHNFEHLPDPIRFLQGAESLLGDGGMLIMALPDCRYTFDRYRPHTLIGEWVEAYRESRKEPTPKQVFEFSTYIGENESRALKGDLLDAWDRWERTGYTDVHCTQFFPPSFELLMLEARALGLTNLDIVKISPQVFEFFVWLAPNKKKIENLHDRREAILKRVVNEASREVYLMKMMGHAMRRSLGFFGRLFQRL